MKKILIVSTVSRQFYLFEQGNIEILHSLGYEIHATANFSDANERLDGLNIIRHHFDIQRSPFSLINIKAYRQLKMLMKSEKFDVVHCHSPMGGVLARLSAKSTGVPTVIYTAHGFHFYKGAPFINWLIYYPIEKFLSKYTDILITINHEDSDISNKFNSKNSVHIPGVGVNIEKVLSVGTDRLSKRKELGIPENAILLLSVGELNKNKNHEIIIKSIANLNNPNLFYIIAGTGDLFDYLRDISIKLGVSDRVLLLGYRNDVNELYNAADIFCFPSYREGLSISLLEAMASGLPCVVSKIRGNVDLIKDGKGGFLVNCGDVEGFTEKISQLVQNKNLCTAMSEFNADYLKYYDIKKVNAIMTNIYKSLDKN